MDPKIWGPSFWYVIHTISFNYPVTPSYAQKRIHHDFYVNLKELIPCENCRKHYQQHLNTHPITPALDSRTDLVKWTITLHNIINLKLGKNTMTVEEVMMAYKNSNFMPPNYVKPNLSNDNNNNLNKNNPRNTNARLYFWIFIFGGFLGYRLYSNYKRANVYYY